MAGSNNSLGTGVVTLTASADSLAADLGKAEKDVAGWGSRVAAGLKSNLGLAAGIGAGIGAGIVGAFEVATKRLDELGKVNKRADVLGVSASDLMGMDELFKKVGVDVGQADAVFAKMGKSIRDTAEEAKGFARAQAQAAGKGLDATSALESQFEAKAKIATLGKMGIKIADLENKTLTDQFKIIADGITRLPKGYEQAAAAQDLFGRSGAQLLPMLQKGSKGIEEFIEHHRKLGGVLSDSQLKSAQDASKAWKEAEKEIEAAWDGFKNKLALVAAPLITDIAKGGKELLHDFLIPAAQRAGEFAKGFTDAYDAIKRMKSEPGSGDAESGSEFFMGKHGERSFLDYFPKAGEVGAAVTVAGLSLRDAFQDAGKQIDDFYRDNFGTPSSPRLFSKEGQAAASRSKRFLDALNAPPPKPPEPIGPGAIERMTEQWLNFAKQGDAAMSKLRDTLGPGFGIGLAQSVPLVAFMAKQAGVADAAWERLMATVTPNANPFRGIGADGPAKFAGAFEKGTREAYSLELRNQYRDIGKMADDPQKETAKNTADVKRELSGIKDAVRQLLRLAGEVEAI